MLYFICLLTQSLPAHVLVSIVVHMKTGTQRRTQGHEFLLLHHAYFPWKCFGVEVWTVMTSNSVSGWRETCFSQSIPNLMFITNRPDTQQQVSQSLLIWLCCGLTSFSSLQQPPPLVLLCEQKGCTNQSGSQGRGASGDYSLQN